MPDKNPTPDDLTRGDRDFGELEKSVVYLLTDPDSYPTIWSVPDIGREIEYFDPESVVQALQRAGLIHRTGDFVFATPAAWRMVQMTGLVD